MKKGKGEGSLVNSGAGQGIMVLGVYLKESNELKMINMLYMEWNMNVTLSWCT